MAQVFVLAGKDVGRSFELVPGLVLGRDAGCGARLVDRSVSRRHARVEREGERWVLVDLGSRNGLWLSGTRVARVELEDHLEVVLGELPLRFRLEAPAAPIDVARPAAAAPSPAPPPSPPTPAPAHRAGPPPAAPAARRPAPEEILLEEEIDLGEDRTRRARRELADPAPPLAPSERDLRRTAFLREGRRAGLLTGDLGQRPAWVQGLAVLLVLALAGALFWAAFQLVAFLRAT